MSLTALFEATALAFDGPLAIEALARKALLAAAPDAAYSGPVTPLPDMVLKAMSAPDAHPVCKLAAEAALDWVPPQTSDDPTYIAHSLRKVHVELLGPEGIAYSNQVRLGYYGMLPDADYGLRTHPAEEVFVMLAGEAHWKRGDDPYQPLRAGGRSYHPSMLAHANKTTDQAFMSIYVWAGDVSREGYVYQGLPTK